MIWQVATRNLFRNARRSLMTIFAIGVSGMAILLFGGFVTSIWFGLQTSIVQEQGHIKVFKSGYKDYGAADPDAYTMDDYEAIMASIEGTPALSRRIAVMTPQIGFGGIAGNHREDNSKTFIGKGVVPSDYNRMRTWDGWGLGVQLPRVPLRDVDPEGAVVGVGMARMIGLCDELAIPSCEDPPTAVVENTAGASSGPDAEIAGLVNDEFAARDGADDAAGGRPRLDLLAASAGGAPNIASVFVERAMAQPTRAVDNAMVMMHFDQARSLLYGDAKRATSILIQAKDPNGVAALRADLSRHLSEQGFDTEVFTFSEVDPTFNRVFGMFTFIFGAISLVLGIVIVFTIINTVTMNVMERINEVGTVRATGLRRFDVFRQFLSESVLLGTGGAGLALALGLFIARMLNAQQIQWTPPSNASPLTINLMVADNLLLMFGTVAFLIAVTVLASILPASNATRIPIVKALNHA